MVALPLFERQALIAWKQSTLQWRNKEQGPWCLRSLKKPALQVGESNNCSLRANSNVVNRS
jgi:hypothetical protein